MTGLGAGDPWAWVQAHSTVADGDTTLHLGGGNELTLHGYALDASSQSAFVFM